MLKLLLKKQLTEIFRNYFYDPKKNKARSKGAVILYFVLFGVLMVGVLGGLLRFNTDGLDFVMTAMFVVIFMDQWLKETHHFSAWIGLAASVACLLLFGADNFLIPTMICILIVLTALRKPIEAKTQEAAK